jgi:predicted TIM-barrel fold metal-dependent hydrolase
MDQLLNISRRRVLAGVSALPVGRVLGGESAPEPVIDIHQHTNYKFRSDEQLAEHQRKMGVTTTILLPSGRALERASTHDGRSNGLAANVLPNEASQAMAEKYGSTFRFGANEVPDIPEARKTLEKFLKAGAVVIGEQKFNVPCDSKYIWQLAEIAREYDVPVLMHFQDGSYNTGIERFHKTLEKFPDVKFIGHAQTWWGNIDKHHCPSAMYPRTPVVAGGISDRLLKDYPNMYADLSAGSGRNSMLRDEEHAQWFLERHQDKIMFGSDCPDSDGQSKGCIGFTTLAIVRRLAMSKAIERKILFGNAKTVFRL